MNETGALLKKDVEKNPLSDTSEANCQKLAGLFRNINSL